MVFFNQLNTLFRYQLGVLKAGLPSQIYWVINDECNLRCQFCNFWKGIYCKQDRKILSTSEIKTLISKMSNLKIPYLLFTGGEPFLRQDLLEILEYAVSKISHIRVQTNGTLITEDRAERIVKNHLLDEIWLSLDGIGHTHDRLRGAEGAFKKVIDGLDKITYFKIKYKTPFPYVVIHTVVHKSNLDELTGISNLCIKYKAGEWFLSYLTDISDEKINDTEKALNCRNFYSLQMKSGINLSTKEQKPSGLLLKDILSAKKYGLNIFIDPLLKKEKPLRPRKKCILLWTSLMLSPYGEVLVCPMLDKYIIGDLLEENLMDVWNNDKFKKNRALVSNKHLPICEECCVQRRTLLAQLKDPANFKRVFIPRKLRELIYG